MSRTLPYGRQSIGDDDIAAVTHQLRDDWLTQGPTVQRFEDRLCELTGARFCVAVSSGTAALHLACLAAGLGPADVALVPDITFVATANAVRYVGGRPVLMDVDARTGLIDVGLLRKTLATTSARAVMPVSFAGSVPPLAEIQATAKDFGALVIEDAAHSLGARYLGAGRMHNSASCAHSDMAILSFHPVKHLTTGEGGAITTNDATLYARLCDLRTHGITKDATRLERNDGPWYYEQQTLGFNYRITDLQCALGVSQAAKFPQFLERRRHIANRYDEAFARDGRIQPLLVPDGVVSAYHLYVVQLIVRTKEALESVASRRKALFLGLRERGIAPQVHYIPVHLQPDFRRNDLSSGTFPGAESFYAGCVSIPMYPALTDEDVEFVIASVRSALDAES